jgi:hypothetical protein
VKRAKQRPPPRPRNSVARSPLLGKGGPHGKSTAAQRRRDKVELVQKMREAEPDP